MALKITTRDGGVRVWLNGELQRHVVEADDERGFVRCIVTTRRGVPLLCGSSGGVITETLRGAVQIEVLRG